MFMLRRPLKSQFRYSACIACQWRTLSSSQRRVAVEKKKTSAAEPAITQPPPTTPGALDNAPRAYGKPVEEFTPKALNQPIGVPKPPKAGDNAPVDKRSWKQRRDDFVDYDKHLERRKELTHKISTPYFREWSNMRMHKGKSFLAPPRLFKAEYAQYFPNFQGRTLVADSLDRDTTPVLEGNVSVVSVYSSRWAENQVATFVSQNVNPELHRLVEASKGVAQVVQMNLEDNALKNMLVKLFMPGLRKQIGESNWGKYFLIKREVTPDIRDAIGLLNSKVGYVYLIDGQCKIRWAGSGIAEEHEKDGLVNGLKKLIEEAKTKKRPGNGQTKKSAVPGPLKKSI